MQLPDLADLIHSHSWSILLAHLYEPCASRSECVLAPHMEGLHTQLNGDEISAAADEVSPHTLQWSWAQHHDGVWLNMFLLHGSTQLFMRSNKFLKIKPSQVRSRVTAVRLRIVKIINHYRYVLCRC